MNFSIVIDWKFAAALGGSICVAILCNKIEPQDAIEALSSVADACKSLMVVENNH